MNKKKFLNRTLVFVLAIILFLIMVVSVLLNGDEKLGGNSQIIKVEENADLEQWLAEHAIEGKPGKEYVRYCFRDKSKLQSHFEDHGIAMGFATAEEYEAAASDVINNPDVQFKTEKEDGDGVFYLEETNEIVFLSKDGFIRTYFLPDAGKAYFDRQ